MWSMGKNWEVRELPRPGFLSLGAVSSQGWRTPCREGPASAWPHLLQRPWASTHLMPAATLLGTTRMSPDMSTCPLENTMPQLRTPDRDNARPLYLPED